MLIQHNPNEGLKLTTRPPPATATPVLIQHNPNEGLKQWHHIAYVRNGSVLIQHNPNEGLKLSMAWPLSAGINLCSFSTTRTRD